MSLSSAMNRLITRIPASFQIHGLLTSMTLIYGIFFPILKLFCQEVGGVEVAVLRQLGFGFVIIALGWTWKVWHRLPCWDPRFKQDWPLFVTMGVLGVFWLQTVAPIAMNYTTAFHATLCMGSIPLQTMLLNALLGFEKISPLRLFGILLGSLGITWLVVAQFYDASHGGGASAGANPLIGDGLILVNAFFFSAYNIGVKKLVQHYDPLDVLSWNFLQAGFLTLLLVFFAAYVPILVPLHFPNLNETVHLFKNLTVTQWGYWLYIVLMAGFLGYWVHHKSLSKTSANNVAAYGMGQPVIAAILGSWCLHEPFTLTMGLAGVVTFTGLIIANKKAET
ncbi:MAG: DMT family transporter [Vampirovibrio sp.]|jgi:drug/metabolite transporter (DMT)-like permease